VVLFASELEGARRQATIGTVLAALVVSHYSTSYVAVVTLSSTWLIYGTLRVLAHRRRRAVALAVPAISLLTVVLGVAMVVAWDAGITNSSSNVTKFLSSLADKGVQVLPNAKGGSVIDRYLNGNVGGSVSPQQFYDRAEQESRATQPWLNPFPLAVTRQYPAQVAPGALELPALVPSSTSVDTDAGTALDELFLGLTAGGVVLAVLRQRKWPQSVPLEATLLLVAFLGFVGLIRLSGTVAGSYNTDRAQLQAAIVLAVALGLAVEWIGARIRAGPALVVAALLVLLFNGTGENVVVTGGDAPVSLANAGTAYDYFVISDGEVSAARWLIATAGPHPAIYTDEYGILRIWDATGYVGLPQTWLTPVTIAQYAWVYAPAYSVVDGRAYGGVDGQSTAYGFPARFLGAVDNLVYSDPTARVYQ
jgi:uncharacterized membrane protein